MFDRLSTLIRQEVFPRLSLGHLAAVLLLGAGAFANFRYGLSFGTTDLERKIAGSASVGADVWNAVGLCLVALAIYGKRYVEAGAGAIVLCLTLAYSINAGLGFAASTRDAVITERAKLVRAEQSREADQAKIEGKIAALGASRGSRAVQVEIDGMLADQWLAGCKKINSDYKRKHCPKLASLREELERALDSEKLEAKLAALRAHVPDQATDKQQASVGSADPLADLVVYFLGRVGYVVKPEDVRPWQNLLFVLLVVLGGPVAMWMAESRVWAAREASKAALEASRKPVQAETRPPKGDDTQPPAPTPTASVGSVPSVPVKNRVIQLTPAAARMLNKIQVSVQNGTDNALWAKSENAMAKSLNVARTSLRRAVAHLQEAGRVTVDDTNGYRLALA
jgi:hypothetical protein